MKKEEMENQVNWELLKKKMDEMQLPDNEKDLIKQEILHKDAGKMRMKQMIFKFYKTKLFLF